MAQVKATVAGKAVLTQHTTRQPIITSVGGNLNANRQPKSNAPAIKSRLQRMPR